MKKRVFITTAVLATLLWLAYAAAALQRDDLMADIFAPFTSLLATAILAFISFRMREYRAVWISAALSAFFWCVGDVHWLVWAQLRGLDPNEDVWIQIIYLTSNLFSAAAAAFLLGSRHSRWNRLQLILDTFAVSCIGLATLWILLLHKQFEALTSSDPLDFFWNLTTFIYAATDVFVIGCLVLWVLSSERSRINWQMYLFAGTVALYALTDLVYCYQYFNGTYNDNTTLDVVYLLSWMMMGIGGLGAYRSGQRQPIEQSRPDRVERTGFLRRSTLLMLIPFVMFIFRLNNFGWPEFLFLLSILVIHQVISGYIASARINSKLLEHEKKMNLLLEEQIARRTAELVAINQELEQVSNHDSITGFFNRRCFMSRFEQMIQATGLHESVALLFVDLDRFKAINDTFGHDIGDKVLIEVARRMREWNTCDATIARLGGDEFVIAIRGPYPFTEVASIADRLIACCNEPIVVMPYQFHITISIGITLYPADAGEHATLLKNADIAMYHAKAQGRNQYAFFSTLINEHVSRRNDLEVQLRSADYDQEFTLRYQPQLTGTGQLAGFEVRLFWNNAKYGLIQPDEFESIAEESGLVLQVSDWLLRKAAEQIIIWNRRFGQDWRMGINISPKQLGSARFIEQVERLLRTTGIQPEWLDFEIVESIAMKGEQQTAVILEKLASLGVNITIDEFGTGYSSLSYLKNFDIDRLKIAGTLIENVAGQASDYQIIKAIIMMAKAMDIATVADGVGTPEQSQVLLELGCDFLQGALPGPAQTAADLEAGLLQLQKVPISDKRAR